VIAVTSYGLAGDADKARPAGCDAYISKPYSPRQLLAKVCAHFPSQVRPAIPCRASPEGAL
jgi:CheY-like chemotaxis protein